MEPCVQYALRVTIFVFWGVGLLPAQSAFFASKKFRFKWFSLGTIIASVSLILSCVNIYGAILMMRALHDQSPAFKLAFIFGTTSALVSAALARFVSFMLCSKLVSLLHLLEEIRIYCFESSSIAYESKVRQNGRLTVGFCLILGLTVVLYVWFRTTQVIMGNTSNPLIAVTLKQEFSVVYKFGLIFAYCNPVVTQRVIIALLLCLGHYLLWAHEQISQMLQHNLKTAGTAVECNSNGTEVKFGLLHMQVFEKLKTCFQMYTDVLGRQIFLIIVGGIGMVTFSIYFMLWPGDGQISPLALPAALLNPALILWIGNCVENQVCIFSMPMLLHESFLSSMTKTVVHR